jgi:hypothetical protein
VAGSLITMGTLGDRIGRRRLLLTLGPRLLPEYRDPRAGRPDLPSAALSLVAVLAVIFGLKQIAQDGPGWAPAAAIVAGLAVAVVFVRRQLTLPTRWSTCGCSGCAHSVPRW